MSTININSENISVFPAVNRDIEHSKDIYSRHASEEFLSGIVNKLIDKDGFVITDEQFFYGNLPFSFNLHGYYFTVETLNSIINDGAFSSLSAGSYLWAYIQTEQHGVWTELAGSDITKQTGWNAVTEENDEPTEYVYSSLQITDTEPEISKTSQNEFKLAILRKTPEGAEGDYNWNGTGWYVPSDSYVKFNGGDEYTSLAITAIDGGDMDK